MKTDNIYIAQLGLSKKIEYKKIIPHPYVLSNVERVDHYKLLKYVIVKKNNSIAIDLNTKKKYLCELPLHEGTLFIPLKRMIPFEAIYVDAPRNLPKRKILEMGNNVIEEINKYKENKKEKE